MLSFQTQKIMKNIIFLPLLFFLIKSQLTIQDKETIEKFILQNQSKSTGFFFENLNPLKDSKSAISVLKILSLDVKHKKEICKKLSDLKEIDIDIVSIDKLLECKLNFKSFKPDLNKSKLVELYNEAQVMNILNINQWKDLYKKLKQFLVQENGKFSLAKIKENKKKTIIATALGAQLLTMIAEKSEDLKTEILPLLQKSVDSLMKSFTEISEDMIVFLEKNVGGNYRINYHVIKAIKDAKKIGVKIDALNHHLYKLLCYFNTFKYEMISSVDNTYYLLNIYKLLEKIPLMQVNKDSFNYLKEKKIKINFENIFGDKIEIKNSTILVELKEDTEKNPKLGSSKAGKKKSSFDLDDDVAEDESNLGKTKKDIKITSPKAEVELDLSDMIKGPGFFILSLNMENKYFGLREHKTKTIRSYSEVKIESVDFEIIDKIKDQNNQHLPVLNNPQKFTKELSANQDCSLIARVKVSFPGGKKPTLMEQVFLRLKNVDLQKSYNAYASKYDKDKNEYFIGFELDDPVNMESYNGIYDLSVMMSDPTIANVLSWDFGKIKISFTKPSDPLDEQRALKNKLQPKMEPTFSPEVKREKNLVIGSFFSLVILVLTLILFVVLIKSNSNVSNFPKDSFAFLMNVLFVGVLGIVAYILFLFWTKFNILQTMFFFVVMSLPASFIVYKALKNHKIEITVDKTEED